MTILLLGADGRLGWELRRALAPLGDVVAPTRVQADLLRAQSLADAVARCKPSVIVNVAAYTDVDGAESERELAFALNAAAPAVLAELAQEVGALLVHYSSEHVFDANGSTPLAEDTPTSPPNIYGATKLQGERLVRASGCRHLILRTAWLYARRGKPDFIRTIARLAVERESIDIVDDQFGAPTGADLVADVSAHLLRAQAEGLYHLSAAGATSRHALALEVVAWLRQRGVPLRVREVRPIPTRAWPSPARRPLNSRLDTRRLSADFGLVLPHWRSGVERLLAEAVP